MRSIINQYSFILFGLILIGLAVYGLSRRGFRAIDWILIIALIGLIAGAWLVMHPTQSQVADANSVRAEIGSGRPVLLEFQSPY
jgi:hypothetical protein